MIGDKRDADTNIGVFHCGFAYLIVYALEGGSEMMEGKNGWGNDYVQRKYPDLKNCDNTMSLNEARKAYREGNIMSQYVFPAVFRWDDNDKTYYATFPDIEGCFTDGATLPEAMANAEDVLNLMVWDMEHDGKEIPTATPANKIEVPEGGFVNLMMADTVAYQEVIDRENNPIKYARKSRG